MLNNKLLHSEQKEHVDKVLKEYMLQYIQWFTIPTGNKVQFKVSLCLFVYTNKQRLLSETS